MAQKYAEECHFEHNPYRSSQVDMFSYVGENIAITNNPRVYYTDLVHGWYNESQYYDIKARDCIGNECRHYTQVLYYYEYSPLLCAAATFLYIRVKELACLN